MISPWERWYSTRCCVCCHVRTGTIILGVWYMLINAVVLLILVTALSDPDKYHYHFTNSELGNDFDQHAAWIIPFFCYQMFDFALNTLVAISVVVYPNTIQDYLQQLGYLIWCVWNCYRYVRGRRNSEVFVYITTNDTTVRSVGPLGFTPQLGHSVSVP
ncbi:lysosomal-associated transmembrane protein 4B-like [Scleropages formosus]|uniref:Lysosomal-associated transmembrane protein 4B-like n=1 Tax=Scleropages formosus TaxID=113540 RepID=A0A0P7UDN5_SCLFO|nr:lysosomal-associated transmembrane protein 4B-like [Scleropages formosus]